MTLHLRCPKCQFMDIILRENAKDWKCPACENKKEVLVTPKKLKTLLKGLRGREGLTQKELAKKAEVSVSTIRLIETEYGSTLETIRKIVPALNTNMNLFLREVKETAKEKIIETLDSHFTDIGKHAYDEIIELLDRLVAKKSIK